MSKRKKRLERIRRNPKNVSYEELRQLLEDFGFLLYRKQGSHRQFKGDLGGKERLITIPEHKPINKRYVNDVLEIIDKILAELESDNDNE